MTVMLAEPRTGTYLEGLAEIAATHAPSSMPCSVLYSVIWHGWIRDELDLDRRIQQRLIREWSRRLDDLGPDEFDARVEAGM